MALTGLQKQGVVFVLALFMAIYQVHKSQVLLNQHDVEAEKQLKQALTKVLATNRGSTVMSGELWRPQREFGSAAPQEGVKTYMIIGKNAGSMPTVRGELFVDPSQRKMKMDKRKPTSSRDKRSKHGKKNPQPKPPLLGFRIYDPDLQQLGEELKRLGLVARTIHSFSAAGDTATQVEQKEQVENEKEHAKDIETHENDKTCDDDNIKNDIKDEL